MFDIFNQIRLNLEKDNKIPVKTLLNLNPSSQVCFDVSSDKSIGTCLRQVWFLKNDFDKTNILPVSNISNFAGNWYEKFFIDQLKEIGMYHNSSFSATDVTRLVKGIVDISFTNLSTNQVELGEIKSYDGSNYYGSQGILGTKSIPPKPRDKHLLQAFRYSLIFKDTFPINNLFYIDRACSQWFKNKQFKIELVKINEITYPKISTIWNDEYYEYTDTRISDAGVYKAEEQLLSYFGDFVAPPKDFIEEYSSELILEKIQVKEIPDYIYNKYKKDPINNPIGDSNCKYCPFAKGLCKSYEDSL